MFGATVILGLTIQLMVLLPLIYFVILVRVCLHGQQRRLVDGYVFVNAVVRSGDWIRRTTNNLCSGGTPTNFIGRCCSRSPLLSARTRRLVRLGGLFCNIAICVSVRFNACLFSTFCCTATLPISMKCVEATGISSRIVRIVLPLGVTLNMNGTALYVRLLPFSIRAAVTWSNR